MQLAESQQDSSSGPSRTVPTDQAPPTDHTDALTGDVECSADDFYQALSVSRRRFVIDVVGSLEPGESTTLGDLASGLAYVENDHLDSIPEASSKERKRVYVPLYQDHLPKLAQWGLIELGPRCHEVTATNATVLARQFMVAARRFMQFPGGDDA